jgi:hypothetical protein
MSTNSGEAVLFLSAAPDAAGAGVANVHVAGRPLSVDVDGRAARLPALKRKKRRD